MDFYPSPELGYVTVPRVSVLLPTLNEAETVERALGSLAEQTYEDFEVIVIDDGSTDGTVDEVRRAASDLPEVEVIERTDERGITSALNRGLEAAHGEYIARQDADDRSHPDRLRRQVEFLDGNPEVVLVGTGVHQVEPDDTYRSQRHVYEVPPPAVYREKSPFVHGTVLIRTTAVRAVGGYDELFPTSEDRDLWIRMAREFDYELRNIDEPLYWLQLSGESAYASDMYTAKLYGEYAAVRTLEDRVSVDYDETVRREGADAIEAILTNAELAAIARDAGQEALRWHKRRESRRYAREALRRRPLDPIAAGTLLLSYAPERVVDALITLYRKKLNREVRRANAATRGFQ